jgi:hypothetical protein
MIIDRIRWEERSCRTVTLKVHLILLVYTMLERCITKDMHCQHLLTKTTPFTSRRQVCFVAKLQFAWQISQSHSHAQLCKASG